jgi:hypothetical protein
MVRRVAEACRKYLHNRADFAVPINYDDLARAAIAAMREPTPDMIEVWKERHEPRWSEGEAPPRLIYPLGSGPQNSWSDAIDAALREWPNREESA